MKAAGKRIVMLPLVLFSDDTSGNKTKKWHKFESWSLVIAGLPRHFNARRENIHFISCSDRVPSLELCKPIAQELTMLETDGVVAFDAFYQEEVLVVAPVLCIVCDNPMATQLCNHLGSSALMCCRLCMVSFVLLRNHFFFFRISIKVDRTCNPDIIYEKRCKSRKWSK